MSHFTPPELLKRASFKDVFRTQNHDNFGLAVLLFHLLFMGRHPSSGISFKSEELTIEQAIENFQFAYSRLASTRGIGAPPRTLSMDILSEKLKSLFEWAFAESGATQRGRPIALQWIEPLDELKQKMKSCPKNRMHKYFENLVGCPWCCAESKSGIFYFIENSAVGIDSLPNPSDVIANAYRYAQAILPAVVKDHGVSLQFSVQGREPKEKASIKGDLAWRISIGMVGSIGLACPGVGWLIAIIGLCCALFIPYRVVASRECKQEREHLFSVLKYAKKRWSELNHQWNQTCLNENLEKIKQSIIGLQNEYNKMEKMRQVERNRLILQKREQHSKNYLRKYRIDQATIPLIGTNRVRTLGHSGIVTAADGSLENLELLNCFGPKLINQLMVWRASLEAKFLLDPAIVHTIDLALNQQRNQERLEVSRKMAELVKMGQKMQLGMESAKQSLRTELYSAAQALAQAEADYELAQQM